MTLPTGTETVGVPTAADKVEQIRLELHRLVNAARFSTTPTARRDATARNVRYAIDNAFDLIAHHL
jgi:hypothetical protein